MKLKTIEKELLILASKKGVSYILTHSGFVNNYELSVGEHELLTDLVREMVDNDVAIVIGDKVFTPYITSYYDEGCVTAGIKIMNLVS